MRNPWTDFPAAHGEGDWRDVLRAHERSTLQRMSAEAVVLCVLETTELSLQEETWDLEPPDDEVRCDLYVHTAHAVSLRREPLGLLDLWDRVCEIKNQGGRRGGAGEGPRWLESYERIAQHARELPQARLVCVGDRETDMLSLMAKARDLGHPVDYLACCLHNRVLPGEGAKLWAAVAQGDPLGQVSFETPSGHGRRARTVTQELRAKRVSLSDGQGSTVEASCVLAQEVAPPGSQPMTWRLLTNRSVETLEQATEVINWHCARWALYWFPKILKEGCRVELISPDEDVERLAFVLTRCMVIAWRLNRLMRLGRTTPDMPADAVFEADEWLAAFILGKQPVPKEVPTLNAVVRLIGQHGGFIGRKGDGEPGAGALWRGLRRVAFAAEGLRLARIHAKA